MKIYFFFIWQVTIDKIRKWEHQDYIALRFDNLLNIFIRIITESLTLDIKMEKISNDQLIKNYEVSELPKSNHLFNFISASQWTEQFSDLRIVVSNKALI